MFLSSAGPQVIYSISKSKQPFVSVAPQFALLTLENEDGKRITARGINLQTEWTIFDYKKLVLNITFSSFIGKDFSEKTDLSYQMMFSSGLQIGYSL
jgi:hypothetical protein